MGICKNFKSLFKFELFFSQSMTGKYEKKKKNKKKIYILLYIYIYLKTRESQVNGVMFLF